jgi:protocatechuate 3,4-dioxygenase beta subunit
MTDLLHEARTNPATTGLSTTLTVRLQVVSANSGRPLHGCTVRLWHCDERPCGDGRRADGRVEVRISDKCGWTEFDGLLPAAGPGRWPHLHFDIHGKAGRLALPGDCSTAYASSSLCGSDLAAAFGVGEPLLIASVTGDERRGLVATRTLNVG